MVSELKIVFAVSELAGIVKTGGLGDVAAALAPCLKQLGHNIRIIMPAYRQVLESVSTQVVGIGDVWMGDGRRLGFAIRQGEIHSVPIYFIEHNHYFDRPDIYTYQGEGYGDNAERYAFFSKAVLETCRQLTFQADIIHGHDWQTGLLPLYLKRQQQQDHFFANTRFVITIHNGAYQQHTPRDQLRILDIDPAHFNGNVFEDYHQINILKGGIALADKVTTVSPTYAKELLTDLGSHGLAYILRQKGDNFSGILNGCDYNEWNPETDPLLDTNYSLADRYGKTLCKEGLQRLVNLPIRADVPVYGMVSRLAEQKGFTYLIPALERFLYKGIQVIIQGSGDVATTHTLQQLANQFPDKCRFVNIYDNRLAHMIEAGSDFFLMPSLFEPCGLNQLYSMKYGTLPIVRAVGGLKDSVRGYEFAQQDATGFMFMPASVEGLYGCLKLSKSVFQKPELMSQLISNAMAESFTWEQSTLDYLEVYYSAL